MNEKKYVDIAKKLLEQSNYFQYTVISNSMYPLISKNDKVICKKEEYRKIKKYSLIAFYSNADISQVPTVHRVIKIFNENGELSFRTKGDNNLDFDKNIVFPNQIIGIVNHIIKRNITITLDRKSYEYISVSVYFILNFINFIKFCFYKIKKAVRIVYKKENPPLHDDNLRVLRQSVLIRYDDWRSIIRINTNLFASLLKNGMQICDISFGGGYCEESLFLIRKGFKIDYKNIEEINGEKKYDFVILSRVLNIFDTKRQRDAIYGLIKTCLKPNGKILISYINKKNSFFIYIKRIVYSFLFKNYNGPDNDDIIYKEVFIMKSLKNKDVAREFGKHDFYISKQFFSGNSRIFLLEHKIV
ncbi:MAG: signal peptidase I [Endomicrobiaceae bacterium]